MATPQPKVSQAFIEAYQKAGIYELEEMAVLEAENVHPYLVAALLENKPHTIDEMVAVRGALYKRGVFVSEAARDFYYKIGELGELGERLMALHLIPITTTKAALRSKENAEALQACSKDTLKIVVTLIEEANHVSNDELKAYIEAFQEEGRS